MTRERKARLIVIALLGLPGLALLLWSLQQMHHGRQSAHWVPVAGTVQASYGNPTARRSSTWKVDTYYRYEYDGQHYSGSRERYGVQEWHFGRDKTARAASQHPAGAPITVLVNPAKPEQAVLYPGSRRIMVVAVLTGLLGMVIGLWAWLTPRPLTL